MRSPFKPPCGSNNVVSRRVIPDLGFCRRWLPIRCPSGLIAHESLQVRVEIRRPRSNSHAVRAILHHDKHRGFCELCAVIEQQVSLAVQKTVLMIGQVLGCPNRTE
jgi:hypothetical protein